jgi:hypothetical protein
MEAPAKPAAATAKAAEAPAKSMEAPAKPAAAPTKAAEAPVKPGASRGQAATSSSATGAKQLTAEERQRYVAEAAYYIAERRGFQGGVSEEDWAEAEAQIERMLAGSSTR